MSIRPTKMLFRGLFYKLSPPHDYHDILEPMKGRVKGDLISIPSFLHHIEMIILPTVSTIYYHAFIMGCTNIFTGY